MNWAWPQLLVASILAIRIVVCLIRDGKEMKVDGANVATGTAAFCILLYVGGFWATEHQ